MPIENLGGGWPVHRGQGADRRLLDAAGGVDGSGDCLGQVLSYPQPGDITLEVREACERVSHTEFTQEMAAAERACAPNCWKRACATPSAKRPVAADVDKIVEAVWRMESAKIIAVLARMLRDVGQAEELAQDALVQALERWPETGVPEQPAAWLTTVAKNRALDVLRHRQMHAEKEAAISYELDNQLQDAAPDLEAVVANALENDIGDDLLRLVFVACHPVLPTDGRVALTLRMLGGLSTEEIARAFLVPEKAVAQRIVRAKRTLAEAKVPFEAPRAHELGERLASVLQVIYLIYNEGYSASAGADWMRPRCARKRCGWGASWPGCSRMSRRCTGWWR
jgi:RNA polymerase sigma factor (sigma-70 family)